MKLTILGNNGPFPAAGGACSGYLVRSSAATVLIDCGNGTLANLQKITGIDKLDAIILTHLHSDHISDMHVLRYAVQIKKERGSFDLAHAIKVYAPPEPEHEYERLDATGIFTLAPVSDETELTVGDIRISFSRMTHPYVDFAVSMECGGKRFVFSGDTSWNDNIISFAKGADLLMLDAGLLEKDFTERSVHLTAAQCGVIAAEVGAKRLLLTHFWPEYDVNDLIAEARGKFPDAEATEIMKEYEI